MSPIPAERRLLIHSHILAVITFVIAALALFLQKGTFSLRLVNQSTAWTAVFLIGLSFAMSGICYFWNFADRKIVYRKHIGIVGFFYGLAHFVLTLYLLSKRANLLDYFTSPEHFWPFFFAATALLYFGFMYGISNQYAAHELGGKHWRMALRFGYVAFIFAMLHFGILGWNAGTLFTFSLNTVFFVFSLLVILMRIILQIHIQLSKKNDTGQS